MLAALREETLRHEARFASDAKVAFLATVSHELRTPLNAIIGYGELLADGISGPLSETQQTQLERIRASSRHLLTLINEVLTLSRLEAGHEPVQSEPVVLAAILERAAAIISPIAGRKQLAFRVCAPNAAAVFESDPMKVTQILVGLLENAVRFTDRGEIVLDARAEPDVITFDINDTGIGIDPANLEHVFAPFWQVECTHTRRPGGTGLGLTVSRRLARLLGGDLTVASALGTGSTFTLRLPLRGPAPVPQETAEPA
jgi:signal transduction histidine kinase